MADRGGLVVRERLLARLDNATRHRLTTIVADAGFGKSVLLRQWLARGPMGLTVAQPDGRDVGPLAIALINGLRPDAPLEADRLSLVLEPGHEKDRSTPLAGMVCSALDAHPEREILLPVDDAHLMGAAAVRFVEALVRQAPVNLHLLLLSRQELPFSVERLPDEVQRITGHDLAFDDDEMSELMLSVLGEDSQAREVRELLGGWPAAVRLAAESLSRQPAEGRAAELNKLRQRGAPDLIVLAREVLRGESASTRALARRVAPFDAFTVQLAERIGCEEAPTAMTELVQRGICTALDPPWFSFPRLLREYLRHSLPMVGDERRDVMLAAGTWFEENDQPEGALRCALDLQDPDWTSRLLGAHGKSLLAAGRRRRVAAALELLGPERLAGALLEVQGALRETSGDLPGALASYTLAARGLSPVPPWLATRRGFLLYQQGDLDAALAALMSGGPADDTADYAQLLAWRATVRWARGEVELGWEDAEPALALAQRLGDPAALAAAHTVLALLAAHRGDRAANREHYELALAQAERAGDVMQVVRIRNNLGSRLLEEGDLQGSLRELETAIELAEASGLRFYLSLALSNRGELRLHLGQYDAAVADLEAARDLDLAAGSPSASSAVIHLANVYRHRGSTAQAQQAYEQAVEAGRRAGDINLLVPALGGLAVLLAEPDCDRATALAQEALSYDPGLGKVVALLANVWVHKACGRLEPAQRLAVEAEAEARRRNDRLGLAEALYLQAMVDPVLQRDDPRLEESAALLADVGARVWLAHVRLEQLRRNPERKPSLGEISELAAQLGARTLADHAAEVGRDHDVASQASHVEIVTLGGFRVRVDGRAIGLTDWPDESARALLERLTARSSWPRAQLARSLGADVERAVDAARRVLDPEGRFPRDHFLVATTEAVRLQHVDVDVQAFLAESAAGLAEPVQRELLSRAEARYAGDFLEEQPGEPWADPLREEARSRYVEVARALARDAAQTQPEAAAGYSRRILERDPYDEAAHLSLITALRATGREGEARRCYAIYAQRLDELGLEALPWGLDSAAEGVAAPG